jgi:hypothetical protein
VLLLLQSVGLAPHADAAAGVAITNSFGMPSMARDFLLADIPAAQAALRPGQVGRLQQLLASARRTTGTASSQSCLIETFSPTSSVKVAWSAYVAFSLG